MLLLVAVLVLGLWRWMRRDVGALQFLAAALLLALAGYAWQGRPGLAGAPKAEAGQERREKSEFAQLRRTLLGETDQASAWLTAADPFFESGETDMGVKVIKFPRDMDLWLGLADALIQHAGGMLTPAAELAFNRAAQVAPDHPAPSFFYGLALARSGQFDAAEQYWRQVLANPQVTDMWRDVVGQAQRMTAAMRADGAAGPAAPAAPALQ
jgi:tetratricopeptide (TPR) repeat protein